MREYLVMDERNLPYFSKGIVDKNLSDVNTFKEYVDTQIERNGGYTETVKTNVEKTNKESYNDMFLCMNQILTHLKNWNSIIWEHC